MGDCRMDIKDLLAKSCSLMYETAIQKCTHDYVDETSDCSWYHSAWQYLRVLNCVSAPQWHEDFYQKAIKKAVGVKREIRVLISGTADYSMLHLVVMSFMQMGINAQIDIVDRCATPLELCKWYYDEGTATFLTEKEVFLLKEKIKINCVQSDLFRLDKEYSGYDIICADAFLTRFEQSQANRVVDLWKQHLSEDGVIITTVRVHETNSLRSKSIIDVTKEVLGFSAKVLQRYNSSDKQELMNIDAGKLDYLANQYIIRMHSCNLGTKKDIEDLFFDNDLQFEDGSEIASVEGEIAETQYYRIIATRR